MSEHGVTDKDGNVPEMRCKCTEIQTELANLRGWAEFYDELPSMFNTARSRSLELVMAETSWYRFSFDSTIRAAC